MLVFVTSLLLLATEAFSQQARATNFRFSKYYEDDMVLQQGKQTVVWGISTKVGDTVHLFINGSEVAHTTVTSTHLWEVVFTPPSGHGPYQIMAKSSLGSLTLNDVLFGDVWICSGQSNMEFPVSRLINHTEEYQDGMNHPTVRVYKVHHLASNHTVYDVNKIDYHWSKPSQATLQTFSALCWLYGKQLNEHRGYPIGLVESNWGGTPIEAWSSTQALAKCSQHGAQGRKRAVTSHTPTALYNGMIYPLLRNTIKGAIWYQGESNSNKPDNYACQFPAMIKDWRRKFNFASKHTTDVNFPFGFVQLAPSRPGKLVSGFTDLRWSQTAKVGYVPNPAMPNTFMAVAMDLPDFNSPYGGIHPRYKHGIARRLVLSALAVAYHETGFDFQGPYPTSYTVSPDHTKMTIEFDHGNTPIEIRVNSGFEVCCTVGRDHNCTANWDHGWKNATMLSHTDSSVVLDVHNCHLGGIRYAWNMSPCELRKCSVYSRDSDLPAPPFKHISMFTS